MESRIETSALPESHGLASDKIVEQLKKMTQRAEEMAVERAKAADRVIRAHPYETAGLAFGLGVLIGLLARRK